MVSRWKNLKLVASCFCAIALTQFFASKTPVRAADTVVVRVGLFAESISVADLQKAADTGKFPTALEFYTNRLSQEQRRLLVEALRTKVPVNVVLMNRLLNTQIGSTILKDISTALVRKDQAGVQALRGALVVGSTPQDGLSILSFIAAYPSKRLEINLPRAFAVAGNLNTGFWRTQQFMLAIAPQIDPYKPQISLPFDPSQPGTAQVQVLKLNFNDQKRDRQIPVDIYWSTAATAEKPVIIYTHGMGAVRTDLQYLAEHLASHGYIFVALEHPGSNSTYVNSALQGKTRLLQPQEFLDRPKDISFVLDELEKLNQTANNPLQGKLATNNVMVIGYSFGGGTALTIAGGELQIQDIKKRCQGNLTVFSAGETLQCIAQELPENSYQLRDARIKQAIAFNPTASIMFGETGLTKVQVPTLVLAGSADKTTPALSEQIIPFTKIPTSKWLVGILGGTHLSIRDSKANLDQIGQPNTPFSGGEVVGEQAADIRKFVKAITLAMAAQLTKDADQYAIFLTPDYAQLASTAAFPFRIVREIPPDVLPVMNEVTKN
ncbi:alpha/beta hydrolase [Nostoc sp. UHCC 0702]|nr:alpha/beta hydrolase [Nostoc sp. UHCC 0702]